MIVGRGAAPVNRDLRAGLNLEGVTANRTTVWTVAGRGDRPDTASECEGEGEVSKTLLAVGDTASRGLCAA
jgi:hypothetical protein